MWRTRTVGGVLLLVLAGAGEGEARRSSLSPLLPATTDLGRAPASEQLRIAVGLELRQREGLEAFLADVQDPASPRYRQFLAQDEFNARYAPAPEAEEAVVAHLRRHGLAITERFPNRLVVGATGNVAAVERAFGTEIHHVLFRGGKHFAAVAEPALPPAFAAVVSGVIGLDDLVQMKPHVHPRPVEAPHATLFGTVAFAPPDLVTFYDDTAGFDGTGQTIVIAGAYAWEDRDVLAFNAEWGLPPLSASSGQVCTGPSNAQGCKFSRGNSIEIALDVEYAHGTAPGARILNYMAASTSFADFTVMYNRIVSDNPGHVVSTSWGACEAGVPPATQQTDDVLFANGNAVGQSWFAASGDSGSRDCYGVLTVDNPANSPHVIGVGGTTPTCSSGMTPSQPACGGYGSETGWDGSGGGVSHEFPRPSFQSGCGVSPGSTRLVPDVALEADPSPGNWVAEGGFWYIVGGTSGAAPQWAGFLAELIERESGLPLGNPGDRLYSLCGTAAFHDVTTGSNGDYSAGPGYDLVTGLGTMAARDFLTATPPPTTTTTTTSTTTTISGCG